MSMKLQVVLEPSDEGGYTVFVPSLPGCISEGEDIEDALSNIQEAIALYLEPIEDDLSSGGCVPVDPSSVNSVGDGRERTENFPI